MNHPDFEDLEDEVREQYLSDAYFHLYSQNKIPYGVSTGDTDTWDQYPPVVELARQNYESSLEDD